MFFRLKFGDACSSDLVGSGHIFVLKIIFNILLLFRKLARLGFVFILHGRLVGLLVNFLSYQLRMTKVYFRPTFVLFEPTNMCNLSCKLCSTGRGDSRREKGRLDNTSFRAFIDKNIRNLAYLVLYNLGEPFLHDNCCDMIKYAVSRNIFVKVSTNGFFKDDRMIEEVLDSGVDEILVSLDFADRDLYRKMKGKDVFDKVVSNIQMLIQRRGARRRPLIVVQFMMTRDNEKNASAVFDVYRKTGADGVALKKVRFDGYDTGKDLDLLPRNKHYLRSRYLPGDKARFKSCPRPWLSMNIFWDGTVVPCCFDMDGAFRLGNIDIGLLDDIWNGRRMRNFRDIASRKQNSSNICYKCSFKSLFDVFVRN